MKKSQSALQAAFKIGSNALYLVAYLHKSTINYIDLYIFLPNETEFQPKFETCGLLGSHDGMLENDCKDRNGNVHNCGNVGFNTCMFTYIASFIS